MVAAAPFAATALLALVLVFSLFHLWGEDLRVPINPPGGDYWFGAMMVKSVLESGWYFETPRLAAPAKGELYDFPTAESVHILLLKAIGAVCRDVGLTINVFYILGYVLTAVSALALFRSLSLPVLPAIAASLLFTFLPQHYLAGEYHLFLTAYYLVPLIVMVMLWLFAGEPLVRRASTGPLPWRPARKGWIAAAVAIGMGSGGVYYAFFACIFLGVIALYRLVETRRAAAAVPALSVAGLIAVTLAINIAPSILYHRATGKNPSVANRSPAEADTYALKLAQLILPIQDHRVPALAAFKQKYLSLNAAALPNNDVTVPLGLVGACGFLLLLAAAGLPRILSWAPALQPLALLNLAGFLVGTMGGLGSLFAYTVSPDIRCYYRICVYLAVFSFTAVLVAVDRLASRSHPARRRILHGAAGLAMALGILDVTPAFPDLTGSIAVSYRHDQSFVRQIENALPAGSAVFQLPYHPFPEHGPIHRMGDYDHLRGYLFSDTLRWSYGAIKGRQEDSWQKSIAAKPIPEMLSLIAQRGFSGIYVDGFGYADGGQKVRAGLEWATGRQPLRSPDGRFSFFGVTRQPAPAVSALVEGCSEREGDGVLNWNWCGQAGEIAVTNRGGKAAPITLTMLLRLGKAGPNSEARVEGLGLNRTVPLSVRAVPYSFDVQAPPGVSRLRISSRAEPLAVPGDPRTLTVAVMNLGVAPR